jgi:hypothetical protein
VVGYVTLTSARSPTPPETGFHCLDVDADPVYFGLEVDTADDVARTSKVTTVANSANRMLSIAAAATSCLKTRARRRGLDAGDLLVPARAAEGGGVLRLSASICSWIARAVAD